MNMNTNMNMNMNMHMNITSNININNNIHMTIHTRVTKLKRGILQYISLEVQSSTHTIAREQRDYVPLWPPKTNVQHQNNFVKIVNCECDKMWQWASQEQTFAKFISRIVGCLLIRLPCINFSSRAFMNLPLSRFNNRLFGCNNYEEHELVFHQRILYHSNNIVKVLSL